MKYYPLDFETPTDLLMVARPHQKPYKWQVEDHLWLAGYKNPASSDDFGEYTEATADKPAIYTLQAANGAGKDSVIGAAFMIWFISKYPRSIVVCTSASASQVEEQTENPCRMLADSLNELVGKRFSYVRRSIVDNLTGGEIKFFATDDPGKAEGHHPNPDYPGAKMAIVLNEVKSIEGPIADALSRCHGFSHWLEYSSPGEAMGHFYWSCQQRGPNRKHRKVTYKECPHITEDTAMALISQHGMDSALVQSSLFAEFSAFGVNALIPLSIVNKHGYAPRWSDNILRAGVDLGLGGDEAYGYIYRGPRYVDCFSSNDDDAVRLTGKFITWLQRHEVPSEEVNVDGSGIGKPIISIFNSAGYPVHTVKNDDKPKNDKYYLNRGAEMWDVGKQIIQGGAVELVRDEKWLTEITTRRAMIIKGRLRLEDKRKARIEGRMSPNRAEAWMNVWAQCGLSHFKVQFDLKGMVMGKQSEPMKRSTVVYDALQRAYGSHSSGTIKRFNLRDYYT